VHRFTPIELAIAFALLGAVAAVAIPTFARELHASRLVEPTDGLTRIGVGAVAHAEANGRFPDPAPMTPTTPPRGRKEADPPKTWDTPTWQALEFGFSEGTPHAYSFGFESNGTTFVARAHGDLDGDGILSTFEVRGSASDTPHVEPGMYVEAELE
jgi:hypothetical protein